MCELITWIDFHYNTISKSGFLNIFFHMIHQDVHQRAANFQNFHGACARPVPPKHGLSRTMGMPVVVSRELESLSIRSFLPRIQALETGFTSSKKNELVTI